MASLRSVRKPNIRQLRLLNQRIVGTSFSAPEQVVSWMLAMQAQDYAGAKWSVGLRCTGATDSKITAALHARKIVRSWPMRGTLHFTAAEDLHWLLALTTPRLLSGAARRREALELDLKMLERARSIASTALAGGRALSRSDILSEIDRRGVSTAGQRGYHILWHLSQSGTLCFGPPDRIEQRFVLLDEWIKQPRRLDRDQALGELARRYFTSHGPATIKDLAGWTKLSAGELKIGLNVARPALLELLIDDVSYWMARESEPLISTDPVILRDQAALLPGFDEYMLGYQNRAAVLAEEYRDRIVPGGNGVFMPTLVVAGEVVGTWRRVVRAKHIEIAQLPFQDLRAGSRNALLRAAELYGRFWERPVQVQPIEDRTSAGGREPASAPGRFPRKRVR